MRIGIISSMQFTEKMFEVRDELKKLGHDSYLTSLANPFVGQIDERKEAIKIHQKNHMGAIREFWRLMQDGDAVLVLNLAKGDVENYVGGNTFLEMGFAHVLNQRIFLYNPIPDNPIYRSEMEAMRPTIINRDLSKVK